PVPEIVKDCGTCRSSDKAVTGSATAIGAAKFTVVLSVPWLQSPSARVDSTRFGIAGLSVTFVKLHQETFTLAEVYMPSGMLIATSGSGWFARCVNSVLEDRLEAFGLFNKVTVFP